MLRKDLASDKSSDAGRSLSRSYLESRKVILSDSAKKSDPIKIGSDFLEYHVLFSIYFTLLPSLTSSHHSVLRVEPDFLLPFGRVQAFYLAQFLPIV